MTIKQWFYKHQNVTLVLFVFITLAQMRGWYNSVNDLSWGWLVFYTLTTLVSLSFTIRWWENEQ